MSIHLPDASRAVLEALCADHCKMTPERTFSVARVVMPKIALEQVEESATQLSAAGFAVITRTRKGELYQATDAGFALLESLSTTPAARKKEATVASVKSGKLSVDERNDLVLMALHKTGGWQRNGEVHKTLSKWGWGVDGSSVVSVLESCKRRGLVEMDKFVAGKGARKTKHYRLTKRGKDRVRYLLGHSGHSYAEFVNAFRDLASPGPQKEVPKAEVEPAAQPEVPEAPPRVSRKNEDVFRALVASGNNVTALAIRDVFFPTLHIASVSKRLTTLSQRGLVIREKGPETSPGRAPWVYSVSSAGHLYVSKYGIQPLDLPSDEVSQDPGVSDRVQAIANSLTPGKAYVLRLFSERAGKWTRYKVFKTRAAREGEISPSTLGTYCRTLYRDKLMASKNISPKGSEGTFIHYRISELGEQVIKALGAAAKREANAEVEAEVQPEASAQDVEVEAPPPRSSQAQAKPQEAESPEGRDAQSAGEPRQEGPREEAQARQNAASRRGTSGMSFLEQMRRLDEAKGTLKRVLEAFVGVEIAKDDRWAVRAVVRMIRDDIDLGGVLETLDGRPFTELPAIIQGTLAQYVESE